MKRKDRAIALCKKIYDAISAYNTIYALYAKGFILQIEVEIIRNESFNTEQKIMLCDRIDNICQIVEETQELNKIVLDLFELGNYIAVL